MTRPKKSLNLEELRQTYQAQIDRRDREIERLKQENILLLKTALKRSEQNEQLRQRLSQQVKKKPL